MALIERHRIGRPELEQLGDLLVAGVFAAVLDGWMLPYGRAKATWPLCR
jgi:hypothetical protein